MRQQGKKRSQIVIAIAMVGGDYVALIPPFLVRRDRVPRSRADCGHPKFPFWAMRDRPPTRVFECSVTRTHSEKA